MWVSPIAWKHKRDEPCEGPEQRLSFLYFKLFKILKSKWVLNWYYNVCSYTPFFFSHAEEAACPDRNYRT